MMKKHKKHFCFLKTFAGRTLSIIDIGNSLCSLCMWPQKGKTQIHRLLPMSIILEEHLT